jgi:hypothetical protein
MAQWISTVKAKKNAQPTLRVLIHFLGRREVVNDNACSQDVRLTELLEFLCCKYFDGIEIFRHASITMMCPPPPVRRKNLLESVIILWFIYLHLLLRGDLNIGNDKKFAEHWSFTCPFEKISKALRRLISKLLNAGSVTYASVCANHIAKWKIRKQFLKKRRR